MKNIILFFRSNIKRSMIILIIALIISFLPCFIYVAMGSNFGDEETDNVKVGLLDYDRSSISIDFKRYLNEELHIDTIGDETYDSLTYDLINRKISAVIEIPEGLEQKGVINGQLPAVIITTLDDYYNAAFIKAYINTYFSSVNLLVKASGGDKTAFQEAFGSFRAKDRVVRQEAAYIPDKEKNAAQMGLRQAIGFFTMMMVLICFCTAHVVMEDRQSGVFNRIQASPVKSGQYITGTGLFAIFSGLIGVAVFGSFLIIRDDPIGVSIGYLLPVMSLFVLLMVGIALIAALFSKSTNAMTTIIVILGTIGPVLGGAYFPVDNITGSLKSLSRITPHYWLMQGVKDLQLNPDADVRANVIILSLFVVLSFLMASIKFVQKGSSRV